MRLTRLRKPLRNYCTCGILDLDLRTIELTRAGTLELVDLEIDRIVREYCTVCIISDSGIKCSITLITYRYSHSLYMLIVRIALFATLHLMDGVDLRAYVRQTVVYWSEADRSIRCVCRSFKHLTCLILQIK